MSITHPLNLHLTQFLAVCPAPSPINKTIGLRLLGSRIGTTSVSVDLFSLGVRWMVFLSLTIHVEAVLRVGLLHDLAPVQFFLLHL